LGSIQQTLGIGDGLPEVRILLIGIRSGRGQGHFVGPDIQHVVDGTVVAVHIRFRQAAGDVIAAVDTGRVRGNVPVVDKIRIGVDRRFVIDTGDFRTAVRVFDFPVVAVPCVAEATARDVEFLIERGIIGTEVVVLGLRGRVAPEDAVDEAGGTAVSVDRSALVLGAVVAERALEDIEVSVAAEQTPAAGVGVVAVEQTAGHGQAVGGVDTPAVFGLVVCKGTGD